MAKKVKLMNAINMHVCEDQIGLNGRYVRNLVDTERRHEIENVLEVAVEDDIMKMKVEIVINKIV